MEYSPNLKLKWMVTAVAGILLAALCIWLAAMFIKWLSSLDWRFESASERAGRQGEEAAAEIIRRVLKEGDPYGGKKPSSSQRNRTDYYVAATGCGQS